MLNYDLNSKLKYITIIYFILEDIKSKNIHEKYDKVQNTRWITSWLN